MNTWVQGALMGAVGKVGDTLSLADADDRVPGSGQIMRARPGKADGIHSISPARSITWTFTPCRRCLGE
ncbi:hypothetical protein QR77_34370 [Streptomyces sp. 150FB]|nr:hypothetical protein QR77_34370 [Streptomyces sp. 150FB]